MTDDQEMESREPDSPNSLEVNARSVEEAIELGLRQLDAGRGEVEVEVLSLGKSGFLGFGSEMARVRVTRLPASGSLAQTAKGVVDRILKGMAVDAISTIGKSPSDAPDTPFIEITGDDSGLLIGRRGETLRALQFIVNLMLNRQAGDAAGGRVLLDVEQYRQRRNRVLRDLALRVADRVAREGRTVTLEPMPPAERRAIHVALADHPRVETSSVGDGDQRKVSVIPHQGSGGPRPRRSRPPSRSQW